MHPFALQELSTSSYVVVRRSQHWQEGSGIEEDLFHSKGENEIGRRYTSGGFKEEGVRKWGEWRWGSGEVEWCGGVGWGVERRVEGTAKGKRKRKRRKAV